MAVDFETSTTDFHNHGDNNQLSGLSAYSGHCWAKFESITADRPLFCKGNATTDGFLFWYDDVGGVSGRTNTISILAQGNRVEGATNAVTTGTWYSLGFSVSASAIRLYIDGVEDANSPASGVSSISDGAHNLLVGDSSVISNTMDGKLAEVCLWDKELSASDFVSLAGGTRPFDLEPASVIFYDGLKDSGGWDAIFGDSPTVNGSPTTDNADHPITYPNTKMILPDGTIFMTGSATYTANTGGSYTLTADAGSLTFTGTDAALEYNRSLAADPGALTFSGVDATLVYGYSLTASPGTFTFSGTDATFDRTYELGAEPGSLTFGGTAAGLEYARLLDADPGTLTFSGTDATLTYSPAGSYELVADPGAFTFGGTDAALEYARVLAADPGALTFSGTDATLQYGYILDAGAGSFTFSGTAAAFNRTYQLGADPGALTFTGTDATLSYVGAEGPLLYCDYYALISDADVVASALLEDGTEELVSVSDADVVVQAAIEDELAVQALIVC